MTAPRTGLPESSSIVIPRLFCRDPAGAMDFCVRAFDAVELGRRQGPDDQVVHGLLTIRSEMVMIEGEWPTLPSRAPKPDGSSPVVIFLYVEDVDRTVARAVDLGAQVIVPAKNQFWGDRIAWIMDPAGHVWTIASRVDDTTAEEREERWSEEARDQPSTEKRDQAESARRLRTAPLIGAVGGREDERARRCGDQALKDLGGKSPTWKGCPTEIKEDALNKSGLYRTRNGLVVQRELLEERARPRNTRIA